MAIIDPLEQDIVDPLEKQPQRAFGAPVEGGPVEADEVSEFFRQHPNIFGVAGAVGGIAELAGNIPGSALQFGQDIAQAITSPIETARGLGTIAKGGLQKLTPGIQPEEEIFNAVAQGIFGKYGSFEAFSEATINDPVATLADLSLFAGGTGALARITGTAGKASKLVKFGKTAQEVGRAIDPLASTITAAAKAGSKLPIDSLIKTALDFSKTKGLARIDELSDAFLARGLNVTRRSLKSLDEDMTKVRKSVETIIDKKTAEGITINTEKIVSSLDDLINNANRQGLEPRELNVIRRMREDFIAQQGAILTPRQLQDLKVGLNKAFKPNLADKFGQVRNKARNKLRDAAKSQLEELHPQLRELNANEGVMIELRKAIENRVIAIEKKPIIPVRGLFAGALAGGLGAAGGADIGTALKFGVAVVAIDKIVTDPRLQVAVAKAINKANLAAAIAGKLSPAISRPAFQAGRAERLIEEQTQ